MFGFGGLAIKALSIFRQPAARFLRGLCEVAVLRETSTSIFINDNRFFLTVKVSDRGCGRVSNTWSGGPRTGASRVHHGAVVGASWLVPFVVLVAKKVNVTTREHCQALSSEQCSSTVVRGEVRGFGSVARRRVVSAS